MSDQENLSEGEVSDNDRGQTPAKKKPTSKRDQLDPKCRHDSPDPQRGEESKSLLDVLTSECYDEGELDYDELMDFDKGGQYLLPCVSRVFSKMWF